MPEAVHVVKWFARGKAGLSLATSLDLAPVARIRSLMYPTCTQPMYQLVTWAGESKTEAMHGQLVTEASRSRGHRRGHAL